MKTVPKDKPRIVPITDPDEIRSIEHDHMDAIIGGRDLNGNYWAYAHSVEKYRRKRSREEAK